MNWLRFLKPWVGPGLYEALRRVRFEVRCERWHRASLRLARQGFAPPIKLHLGSGTNRKPGWIQIDLLEPSADLRLDLRRPWPFADESVEAIYSEHFLEHLEFRGELEKFLAESLRVLRPGGSFEAGVPDAERSLRAYAQGDAAFFAEERALYHPKWCVTPMDSVNFTFRQGSEHKYAYDYETLALRLSKAGFVSVERRLWQAGHDTPGWETTLYVVAYKKKLST